VDECTGASGGTITFVDAGRASQEQVHAIDRGTGERYRTTVRIGLDLRIRDEMGEPALAHRRRRLRKRHQVGCGNGLIAGFRDSRNSMFHACSSKISLGNMSPRMSRTVRRFSAVRAESVSIAIR
jgi:hypothetical protein